MQKAQCGSCGSTHNQDEMIHESEIDDIAMMSLVHFGNVKLEHFTCQKCADFKMNLCAGENKKGMECWWCMVNKVRTGEVG
jgi:hypothetical protein